MRKTFLLSISTLVLLIFSLNNLPAVNPNDFVINTASNVPVKDHETSKGVLTRSNFESSISELYQNINLSAYGLDYSVFRLGMIGYYSLQSEGTLNDRHLLTIIDFSKPSTEKRFFTIDLGKQEVKFHTYVAHGKNTGENLATSFSNKVHSNQSSMGFYVTGETYVGSKGYSLRLDGKDKTYNDQIRNRAVVMHEADYVSESWIKRYGRLGRSQGCPALPKEISRKVIDTIKNKTAIFAYYPDEIYLTASKYLDIENLFATLDTRTVQLAGYKVKAQS